MSNYNHPIRDPNVGSIIDGRYYLQSLIGRGATSSVYEATDSQAQRSVAVKLMHSHLVTEEMIVNRFAQEAKTARLLQHPNIVKVEEYNVSENGVPYLIMELVKGTSLQDVVKGAGWLPTARAFAVFSQVCAALAAAHEKSIVHRDLKPSNIMLTTTDGGDLLVKVLDFGIAKQISMDGDTAAMRLTQAGEALGSILYMSPEQCLDQDIDSRSDCYSMGCVMYETLTGKPPLCARTAFETMNKQISEMPERLDRVRPDLDWPGGLQEVVFKAMAKNPSERYQKITDLQDHLQKVSANKNAGLQGDQTKTNQSTSDANQTVSRPPVQLAAAPQAATPATVTESIESPDQTLTLASQRQSRNEQLNTAVRNSNEGETAAYFGLGLVLLSLFAGTIGTLSYAAVDSNYGGTILVGSMFLLMGYLTIRASQKLRSDFKKLQEKISEVKKERTVQIWITKITSPYPVNAHSQLMSSLIVDFKTFGEDQPEKQLFVTPILIAAHVWSSLCTASQLESVSRNNNTFPISASLFLDSNGNAIAAEIAGNLVWIPEEKNANNLRIQETNTFLENHK